MIKAILFDMVGVLVFKKDGYSSKTPNEVNAQNIENLFNNLNDEQLMKDIKEKLKLSDDEINRAVPQIPAKFKEFTKLWEILPEVKKHYKIAVINNGNSIALKYWKEKFDFGIFDLFINSAEVGFKKPDPKIFLLACEKLKVKPDECLFMDDSLENVESAQKLGMKIIWWNKEENRIDLFNKFSKNMDKKEAPSDMWQGVVLEESLEDKSMLDMARIVGTDISKLEKENRVMTFYKVEVPDSLKGAYIEKAKTNIKQGFYTHLCRRGQMVVVFKNRVFSFRDNDPQLIKAREYGKTIGIIPEQMPFEHLINNPFD